MRDHLERRKSGLFPKHFIMKPSNFSSVQVHSALYGFGFIGAMIYFIQHAQNIWAGLFGIVEAIFWPAVLVYKLFEYLHI